MNLRPAGLLLDWPIQHPIGPFRLANEKCDSEIQLDDLIVSPLIGIAHFEARHARQRTVAPYATPIEMFSEWRPSKMVIFARNRKLVAYAMNASDNQSEIYPVRAKASTGLCPKEHSLCSEVQRTI